MLISVDIHRAAGVTAAGSLMCAVLPDVVCFSQSMCMCVCACMHACVVCVCMHACLCGVCVGGGGVVVVREREREEGSTNGNFPK